MNPKLAKTLDSGNKMMALPATFAWKFDSAHESAVQCTGDIDGDGRDEVIVTTVQETSAIACLSVVSYVQPSDLDPGWAAYTDPQLVVQWTAPAGIPKWVYPTGAPVQSCANMSYATADVDGDGVQEVIAYFPGYSGAQPSLGVLKWQEGSLTCIFQATGSVGGAATYSIPSDLQFYKAPKLTGSSGGDALLASAPGAGAAVLVWQNGGLQCIWQANGTLGGTQPWTFRATDQYSISDVDNDGALEWVMLSAGSVMGNSRPNAGMAVAKWTNNAFSVSWSVTAAANNLPAYVSNSVELFCGDLDNSGTTRVILLTEFSFSVLEWQGSGFSQVWSCGQTVPGVNGVGGWMVNTGGLFGLGPDHFYLANIDGGGDALFVVSSFSSGAGAVLQWTNGGLGCVWQGAATNWGLQPANQFFFPHFTGTGSTLLGFQNNSSIGILNYGGGNLNCVYNSPNCVLPWNLHFLVGFPSTPFAPFTGTQLDLYQKICENLTPPALGPDHVTGDIRYQYGNLTNSETFSGWATQIKDMPQIPGYSTADWDAVAPVICAEAGWVGTMYGFSTDMVDLTTAIANQQDSDLLHCMGNMALDQASAPNPTPYWTAAIVDAAMWGLAAIPGGFFVQAGIAVAASLFGSWANQPTSGSTPPVTVQYDQFKGTVDAFFSSAFAGTFFDLNAVVTDPIKLRVAGSLAEGAWYWGITDNTTVAQAGSAGNRVMFYQMVMAAQFNIWIWNRAEQNYPVHRWQDYQGGCELETINAPAHAYWSIPNGDGTFTVALLAQGTIDEGGGGVNLVAFPEQSLMTDLFTTLQVPPADLALQRFGWDKIPNPPTNDMC